jgi:hypothetical protein
LSGVARLRQFPNQGVLATTGADDENFHFRRRPRIINAETTLDRIFENSISVSFHKV